ncbi:MAG: hypothetical protein IKK33_14360 [Lachnospiraceae bacterium]|nr:hypothetical protein [Lachnospiraceae bacterium]
MEEGNEKNYPMRSKTSLIVAIACTCVCVVLILYVVIHPRALNIVIGLIALYATIKLWMKRYNVNLIFVKPLFIVMIVATILIAFPINSRHASWEYKGDIKEFKSLYPKEFEAFPDELPKEAKDVQWMVVPGLMQGSPYELLVFKAPQSYLDEVVERFEAKAKKYVYDREYGGLEIMFPYYSHLSDPENTEIYVLYDNGDNNHLHMYGFWINSAIGEIGFFEE